MGPDGAVPPDAATLPDGGLPRRPTNCGPLAEGCSPGQPCPPACDCVLARERMALTPMAIVDQCILVAGAGPPSIEIKSHVMRLCE